VPPALSPRLAAIVEALPLRHSRVLEIGCGPGAAARAVAARLVTGHILAIDRSASAVAQARAAAADDIAAGRMSFRHAAVEDLVLQPDEEPYDLVLAVRVGALDGRHIAHITDASGQRRVLRMDYSRYGLSLLFERDAAQPNALVVIDIDRAQYHTTGGIHVRSSKRALLRAHHQVRCGSLSGGEPGEEVCAIEGDGRRTVFVTTKSRRIRSIQIGAN
jgi:Methyltransferase domain